MQSLSQSSQEISRGVTDLLERAVKHDEAEERRLTLKWLDPTSVNVENNLKEGLKHHHPGTGEWLLESTTFKSWLSGPSSLLWVHGIRKPY
jgi:hypothetical protein